MAPPPAARNFQQHQPITTALRQICESYPAASCLRELLQNADDAGATEVEYLLDTETYLDKPLLCDELEQYQGPALLARNNNVFSDKDFESLSSIGDSRKRHEAEATGKFGQGFNSCYHWTDGPWVYSRTSLLLLDPHEGWSTQFRPGGPTWDVVEHSDSQEIQNHMKTFQKFGIQPTQPYDGTIIRLPLRTKSQAQTSKIVGREANVSQISEALALLGQEVKQGGLLFLKNIRKMSARIDDRILWQVNMCGHDAASVEARQNLSSHFKALFVVQGQPEGHSTISESFRVDIQFTEQSSEATFSYLVHHLMKRSTGASDMDSWSRAKKLFPWVAIAAPIACPEVSGPFRGRLFSILRLPLETGQPVHIHGLFSITPDRGRLSSSGQTPGYEDMETKWNDYLFQVCVAEAWSSLLAARSAVAWQEEGFRLWPRIESSPTTLWTRLDEWVLGRIIRDEISVWVSTGRCVPMNEGYFAIASDEIETTYGPALASVDLPAVYLSQPLLKKATLLSSQQGKALRMISPAETRRFLCGPGRECCPSDHSPMLLEYLLLDAIRDELGGTAISSLYGGIVALALWPMVDLSLSPFGRDCLLLPRDEEEMSLFNLARANRTVDIGQLQPRVLALIEKDIKNGMLKAIRYRTLDDLSIDWPFIYQPNPPTANGISRPRPVAQDQLVTRIWKWISQRHEVEKVMPTNLANLWLLPIMGDHVRQLMSEHEARPILLVQKSEPLYRLLDFMLDYSIADVQIVDFEILPQAAIKILRALVTARLLRSGASSDHLETLLLWLVANKLRFQGLPDQQNGALLHEIAELVRKAKPPIVNPARREPLAKNLRQLPLFSRMDADLTQKRWATTRTSVDPQTTAVISPKHPPCIQLPPGLMLFNFEGRADKDLQNTLSLVSEINLESLLFEHLIPFTFKAQDPMVDAHRYALTEFTLENSRTPSRTWVQSINSQAIIPVEAPSEDQVRNYRRPGDLIDPNSRLARLYFEEERIFPARSLAAKYSDALQSCGIVTKPNWQTPLDRARHFSTLTDLKQLPAKVEQLLALPLQLASLSSQPDLDEIRALQWLPIRSSGYELHLYSPMECRGADERDIADLVFNILEMYVSPSWKRLLGWHQTLSKDCLHRQLEGCVREERDDQLDQVLRCLYENHGSSSLRSTRFILGSQGAYMTPRQTCLPNGLLHRFPLAPHRDEVDKRFASRHAGLISDLGIPNDPSLDDLLEVQTAVLASKHNGTLEGEEMDVALSMLEIASRFPEKAVAVSKVMIPDTERVLRLPSDICFGDKSVALALPDVHLTHPRMSTELIQRLGIETVLERATRLQIEIDDDDDDDEYVPQEQLTTVIADTLSRYAIESTFSEFLANAEDCQASEIAWILDVCKKGPHASASLLTPEMTTLQGPSLYAWNDQVFSDKDFEGYKDIGRGGKGDDEGSIGLFGRGSMTMYHFTDNPMILSAGFLLILDPQQRLLPRNKLRRRKAGVKLPLKSVRRICCDQLTPFEGLGSYTKDMDHYQGTLFRMPLKYSSSISKSIDVFRVESLLFEYFTVSKESLLFLKHVKKISFHLRGAAQPAWCASADRAHGHGDEIFQQIKICGLRKGLATSKEVWRVGMTDIEKAPPNIQIPTSRVRKVTECGIAACLRRESPNSEIAERIREKPKSKFYCKLPTAYGSALPVSIHASFSITGDRRTISIDDSKDPNMAWNCWLLEECVSDFYIEFLKDLAPRNGSAAFEYWPSTTVGSDALSRLVANSFWDKVRGSKYSDYPLYPLLEAAVLPSCSSSLTSRSSGKRKLHEVSALRSAVFDLLLGPKSSVLQPLLCSWCPRLVRPPARLFPLFEDKDSDQFTVLNAQYMCQLLKNERNCAYLDEFLAGFEDDETRAGAVEMLLMQIIPGRTSIDPNRIEDLNGCRILPFRNGSMKVLRKVVGPGDSAIQTEWAILPSEDEQKIFGFAQDCFVDYRLFNRRRPGTTSDSYVDSRRNPIEQLIGASFNIRKMQPSDIGAILTQPSSPLYRPNQSPPDDEWFSQLWLYLNSRISHVGSKAPDCWARVAECVTQGGLQHCRIYRVRAANAWRYINPEEYQIQPCMITPVDAKQARLCDEIEGLQLVERRHVFTLMLTVEGSLNYAPSMIRLMRALQAIEKQSKRPVKASLQSQLSVESVQLLQDLLLQLSRSSNEWTSISVLSELPVWPRQKKNVTGGLGPYLAARDAIFCKPSALLTPWTNGRDQFIDPSFVREHENKLVHMGFHMEEAQKTWKDRIERFLPSTLTPDMFDRYTKLIQCLSSNDIKPKTRLAPNGQGSLRRANELYDDSDPIFIAAFRQQEDQRFIHSRFRSLDRYWLSLGLRSRPSSDALSFEDYLECARAIDARFQYASTDADFTVDARSVASYLSYEKAIFHSWPAQAWSQLAEIRMFEVKTDFSQSSLYTQARMHELGQRSSHVCLQDAGNGSSQRLVWSQQLMLKQAPATYLYQRLPQCAKPAVEMVYAHLLYLIQIRTSVNQANVPNFLRDLQECYSYFQDNHTSVASIPAIQQAKIWLNIDTTDVDSVSLAQIQDAPIAAQRLCINSPTDPAPYKNACSFLIPYEKLLKGLGVHAVITRARQPWINSNQALAPSESLATNLRRLRDQGKMLDVTFQAQGLAIRAHKLCMASASEYCETQFSGEWGRLLEQQATINIGDIKGPTLRHMVDFAYGVKTGWPALAAEPSNDSIADRVDELLDLLQATDMWFMKGLHDITEQYAVDNFNTLVRPDNVEAVKVEASNAKASHLERACADFIEDNLEFVKLYREPDVEMES